MIDQICLYKNFFIKKWYAATISASDSLSIPGIVNLDTLSTLVPVPGVEDDPRYTYSFLTFPRIEPVPSVELNPALITSFFTLPTTVPVPGVEEVPWRKTCSFTFPTILLSM